MNWRTLTSLVSVSLLRWCLFGATLAYGVVYLIEFGAGCLAFRPLSILASWPFGLQASVRLAIYMSVCRVV